MLKGGEIQDWLYSAARTLFVERRIPDRVDIFLQEKLYKRSTERAVSAVLDTPPLVLDATAQTEIRMLTSNANVNMSILALKSFLRFYNKVKVVVHDDGSLTTASKERIRQHIRGAEVISLQEADKRIRQNKNMWLLRKEAFSYFKIMPVTVYKLFDLYLLSSKNKVMFLDSDILFLKEPTAVLRWIKDDAGYNLYARPNLRNLVIKDSVLQEKFGDLNIIKKFNSGLLCMRKDLVRFEYVLDALKDLKDDQRTPILGDECIWRFAFSRTASRELPFEDYPLFSNTKNFKKFLKTHSDPGYVHFLLKHAGGFYRKFADQVVRELLPD